MGSIGRSRSSPMFVQRKKSAAIETQEPTSPKVTCMGQVRVKQSSKQQQPRKRTRGSTKRWCKWMGKNDKSGCFCRRFKGKRLKPRSLKPVWCKREAAKVFASPASTPLKNVFLLTRCRSAPYRSSSLASRVWGEEEEEEEEKEQAEAKTEQESGGEKNPTSGRESICRDSDQ
ncbi:uncharacterized protein LOC112100805 [Citrus clementina]|uniref:uncharacterized protein LOC112100805 n=1 Tax=Citrus clementina TaxID=85681 RepID=UPI000CECF8FA|nr:uncharacterized protein LOC112100805 [Citrus x clementina]